MVVISRVGCAVLSGVVATLSLSAQASAQESKSGALAKQLTSALDAGKLDSIAAKESSAPDAFCAALYFPGAQLLVVAARYSVPQLLDARLGKKEFRDTYLDLNGAAVPASKVFIQDGAADGLKAKNAENQAPDIYESGGKQVVFDGDAKRQKLSDQEYQKLFADADERYAQILTALIAQLKKTS
jgi:hypothetical protein